MQADTIFLGILVLCVIIVLAVVLYNMHQENQYRREIFKQFGHSNKDALLDEPISQIRDGEETALFDENQSVDKGGSHIDSLDGLVKAAQQKYKYSSKPQEPISAEFVAEELKTNTINPSDLFTDTATDSIQHNDIYVNQKSSDMVNQFEAKNIAEQNIEAETVKVAVAQENLDSVKDNIISKIEKMLPRKLKKPRSSISITELEDLELPWFNKCFDYMGYISLNEAKELTVLPRLSSKHRFKIAACNLDDQFQLAEPIPGVKYQAYIVGMQAISRAGLASRNDLILFGKNIQDFAKSVDGNYKITDIDEFLEIAYPMDELCARVDQIIALHLVSRDSISGIDLRATLEKNDFVLSHDGAFYYPSVEEELFKIVNLDETPFTSSVLSTKSFKGFSVLFDITRVPPGERNFDKFMGLSVKLANELGLDLVDDKLEELSTEWLRSIGQYVLERQKEMEAVGIIPGKELAKRLFT